MTSGIKGFELSDEPEFDSAGFSIEDREIDIDTNMDGEFVKIKDSND